MVCKQCGFVNDESSKFCYNCGFKLPVTAEYAADSDPVTVAATGYDTDTDPSTVLLSAAETASAAAPAETQPASGQYYQQSAPVDNIYEELKKGPSYPMGWYKALIYFVLFLFAVINIASAGMLFTGYHYERNMEGAKDLVYEVFPKLKTIDSAFGVLFILLAVFAIIVRFQLAGYKKGGPKLLYLYFAGNIALNIAYAIIVKVYVNSEYSGAGNSINVFSISIPMIIFYSILIITNKLYFDKRSRMFNK